MAETTATIVFKAKDEATKKVKEMGGALEGVKKTMGTMAKLAVAAFSVAVIADFVKSAREAEVQTQKMVGAMKSLGLASSENIGQMEQLANDMQKFVGIEDDTVKGYIALAYNMGVTKDKMRDVMKGAAGLSKAFGVDMEQAVKMSAKAYEGNYDILQRYIPALKDAKTEAEKMELVQKAMANGLQQAKDAWSADSWAQFDMALGDLKETIGTAILPAVNALLQALVPMIQKLVEWGQVVIPQVQAIAMEFFTNVTTWVNSLGIDWNAVWTAIQVVIQAVWSFIMNEIVPVAQKIFEIIGAAVNAFRMAWETNFLGIQDIFKFVWDSIVTIFEAGWNAFKSLADIVLGIFTGDWNLVWEGVKGVFSAVWYGLIGIVTGAWELFKKGWDALMGVFQKAWDAAWGAISGTFSAIWDGMVNAAKAAADKIIGWAKNIIEWVQNALNSIGDLLNQSGNLVVGEAWIPQAEAMGGPVNKNQPYMVGEVGPELFIPDSMGRIVPNNELSGAIAGSGGGGMGGISTTVYFDFSGSTLLDQNTAVQITDMVVQKLKQITRLPSRSI